MINNDINIPSLRNLCLDKLLKEKYFPETETLFEKIPLLVTDQLFTFAAAKYQDNAFIIDIGRNKKIKNIFRSHVIPSLKDLCLIRLLKEKHDFPEREISFEEIPASLINRLFHLAVTKYWQCEMTIEATGKVKGKVFLKVTPDLFIKNIRLWSAGSFYQNLAKTKLMYNDQELSTETTLADYGSLFKDPTTLTLYT